jgi:hypothetical protein
MSYLDNTKQALGLASDKLSKADLFGAVTLIQAALEQVVAHLRKEDLNFPNSPDVIIYSKEDFDGKDQQPGKGS